MNKDEIEYYLELHKKALLEKFWETSSLKWCDLCEKFIPTTDDKHWRRLKGGSWRCKKKDRLSRESQLQKRHTTIDGFLRNRYGTIRERCTRKKCNRYNIYKGKLSISLEEFIKWGESTLPSFLSERNIKDYGHGNVQVSRGNHNKPYEIGNIKWATKKEHTDITIKDQSKKVVQLDLDGNVVKIWDSVSSPFKSNNNNSFFPPNISRACNGEHDIIGGYRWLWYK